VAEIPETKRIYVDESGIKGEYQREYGYAERGKKVCDTTCGRDSERINIIGGLCNGTHIAVEQYGHTTNAAFFEG
jgi:hypothetical protein